MYLENITLSERSQSGKVIKLYELIYLKCPERANPQSHKHKVD